MSNPVRDFAEVVRQQLKGLIHFRKLDEEIFELDFEGWERHGGINQWTRQDQRRLRNYLLLQNASPCDLNTLPYERGRADTRVRIAFRLFRLESQVVQARQKAIEFCADKPEYSTVPAVITAMAIAHRKWKQSLDFDHDLDGARDRWNDAFNELFDWIDEIESNEQYEPKPRENAGEFEEGLNAAVEAIKTTILQGVDAGIPPEKRSKPMSKLQAMDYIGWPAHIRTDRAARDWLNKSIELGIYRCESTTSGKRFIFHIDDFPEQVRGEIKQR